jgi:mannose-6-phosphate isomerase-like protein (cupin superfamily)
MPGIVVLPGESKSVRLGGLGVVFKLLAADTGGTFALVEHPIEPGTLAAPPHRHQDEDEASYVLEGEVTVEIGKQIIYASPGTLVFKPRGIFHTFWNQGAARARILEIISPAGFEKYFEEVAALAALGVPPDDSRRRELAEKYHVEFDRSRVMEIAQKYNLALPSTPR